MKPHLPLLLLSALLATAPANADAGYYAYMSTLPGQPAFVPAIEICSDLKDRQSGTTSKILQLPSTSATLIYCQPTAPAFFKTSDVWTELRWSSLTASQGSIVLRNIKLVGSTLITKNNGVTDTTWGYPQIALDGVLFDENLVTLSSNYCTIRNWTAASTSHDGRAVYLTLDNATSATFSAGTLSTETVISSAGTLKFDGLSLNGNALHITYSGNGSMNTWDVDMGPQLGFGTMEVTASKGRVKAGFISGNASISARDIQLTSFMGSHLSLRADKTNGFLIVEDSVQATEMALTGTCIYGNNSTAVFTAQKYNIDASDEVRIQGTFQGGDLTLTAGGAVTLGSLGSLEKPLDSATITGNSALPVNMQSFRGRTLDITTGGAVYVDTIVSSDEQKKRTTINAGGDVNLGSFQGNELRFDAGGDVNLGSFQGEVLWFGAKGNAIYVGSIGSLEHPVYDAIIGDSNTTASVTVDSFHCREEDGTLTIESKGVITIGKEREQGSGGAGLPVNEGIVTLRYYGEGRGDEVWDVQVIGEVRGGLYVTAHSGRVDAGHISGNGDIAAKDIHVSSFEGSDLKLYARKNATVLGNIDATGSLIIKPDENYESGYADIYIQTDETVQAKTISMQGKDIVSDSAKVVFTAESYDIGATGEITFAGTLQGGKIDMTAAGNISLNAVGSSGDPVGTTHITSTEGDITLNSYQGGGLLMSAGGTLNIVKELAISTGFVEVETASEPQRFSACLRGASVSIECDLADNENGYGLYVEATGTQETDTGITISENLDAGKSGKADQLKSAKDINLNGLTSGFLQAEAAGTVTFGGDVQVAGLNGQKASFRAGDEVVFNRTAELTDVDMRAPKVTLGSETTATRLTLSGDAGETPAQVTFGDELTLKDQSRIEGNVASSQSDAAITVENSTITGTVSRIGTVNLVNGIIGSAEQFSTLTVQSASQSASQITSDLVLSNDATLSFILGTHNLNSPVLTIGGEMKADITEDFSFTINLTGNNLPVLQKYALITTTNKAQAPDFWKSPNVRVSGLSSDPETLFWEDGTLYFSLGGPELEVATWIGEQSRAWNTEDFNWKQGDNTYQYKDDVAVVFNDEGKERNVELNGELAPKSVLVENSEGHDYTFTGKGKLIGETVLVKQGAGTLTVNTANDYAGGTTIAGGTLVMGRNDALGSGEVKLEDAKLDLNEHTLDNKISVTGEHAYLGNGRLDGNLTVENGGKLTLLEHTTITEAIILGNGAALDLGGNTSSCTITLKGNATLGNGTLIKDISVGDGKTLTLCDDLSGDATITLGHEARLNLARNTLNPHVKLIGNASIGKGTLNGDLEVGEGRKLSLTGGDLLGSGSIILKDNAVLALGGYYTPKDITATGNATISNGSLGGTVTVTVQDGGTLFLGSHMHTDIGAALSLGEGSTANLGGNRLNLDVTLTGSAACIGNGTLDATLNLAENKTLTVIGSLGGESAINMADGSTLNLGDSILSKDVNLKGNASISGGRHDGNLNVEEGKRLTLCGSLGGKNAISLANGSTLDLNKNILSKTVSLAGSSASIGKGTLSVNLTVDAQKTLKLCGDLDGERAIILESLACLDLNSYTLSSKLSLIGVSATIGGGALDRDLFVGDRQKLTVKGELSGKGSLLLGSGSTLLHEVGDGGGIVKDIKVTGNGVTVSGNATIGEGSFCGHVSVESGMTLSLQSGTDIQSGITLEENTGLALGGAVVASGITVSGNAGIGGGTLNSSELTVAGGKTLTLNGNLEGSGTVSLGHAATLQLNEKVLSNSVLLQGDATIGNGIVNGAVEVGGHKTLALRSSLEGSGIISLGNGSTLRLENATVGNKITGGASTTIVTPGGASKLTGDLSGFSGNVIVEMGSLNIMSADSVNVADATIGSGSSLGVYRGRAIPETPSLDSEGTLTVSGTLTAQDANSWLYANLVMESGSVLDVSATGGNGGLHMGSTVTLAPGNVLLSEADMDAVNGLRYMQAYDLFSGVDGLSLDNGHNFLEVLGLSDSWVKASEVFANDQFKNPEKEYYLFYSGKNQGGAVGYEGTVYLMRLPEPTTGTLSLLALAALAARRRRK